MLIIFLTHTHLYIYIPGCLTILTHTHTIPYPYIHVRVYIYIYPMQIPEGPPRDWPRVQLALAEPGGAPAGVVGASQEHLDGGQEGAHVLIKPRSSRFERLE